MIRLTRQQSQQMTRGRLRSAAAAAFARQGVSATSVDGIAEAAGFSRGAFYSNYKKKIDLLLELMEEEQTHEIGLWPALIDEAENFESLMSVLERRFDDLHDRDGRELLMMELQLEAARNEAFGAAYEASSAKILARMSEVIQTLADKMGNRDIDAEATAIALRALAIGLAAKSSTGHREMSGGKIMTIFLRQALGR